MVGGGRLAGRLARSFQRKASALEGRGQTLSWSRAAMSAAYRSASSFHRGAAPGSVRVNTPAGRGTGGEACQELHRTDDSLRSCSDIISGSTVPLPPQAMHWRLTRNNVNLGMHQRQLQQSMVLG